METLVLNASWQPTDRVHWTDAVRLFFLGKAQIVEEYEDAVVRSVTFEMKVPSVIRLVKSILGRKKHVRFSRENVYDRDKGCCQYCGNKVPRHDFSYDHVIPRAQGGKTEWTNIVVCCTACNTKKAARTPAQAGMKLRSTPVRPTKASDKMRFTLTWRKGMPETWANWITSAVYWNGELDSDE